MGDLPVIICTSVIRSSQQGESHGGMYIVDLNSEKYVQVLDWNDQSINWEGRGADRGLRGIAFYNDMIIAAASDEIFFYDQQFRMMDSFRNPYLKHCHEICISDDILYLSSTGYDSIITFNLRSLEFEKGYCYRSQELIPTGVDVLDRGSRKVFKRIMSFSYDLAEQDGPDLRDTLHINNVFAHNGDIFFSGRRSKKLMRIDQEGNLVKTGNVPKGTHNVQFYGHNLLMNSTDTDSISVHDTSGKIMESFIIPTYEESELLNNNLGEDHARQAFGRGLCTFKNYIIGGSSPGTISLYHSGSAAPVSSINLTRDLRNAIHGLEVYPYDASAFI